MEKSGKLWGIFCLDAVACPLLAHGLNIFPPLALFPHSDILFPLMAEKLDPNEIVTLEELAISSMWEMAPLVEVLEKKDLLPKGR